MALAAGAKLGHYEVLGFLGAGGMGEVYRALDPRLKREVALKILPADFAGDSERLRRFEQEARTAGALNHPNLLAVYDVGAQDGTPYLVSELLQGETLRARLAAGPMPARRALEIATQMAQGLAAAHEHGIIHRDLKPENIFVCKDGRVKILDFGLAKLTRAATVGENSATFDETQPGLLLGTVAYMAPEQVRGRPADARSDIFSFGVVLYEMLSGKRLFQRETPADTTTAILVEEPPNLGEMARGVPPALERIVLHCLEKEPERRFQSMRDLGFSLQSLSTLSSSESGIRAALPSGGRLKKWGLHYGAWAIVVLLLVNLGVLGWWLRFGKPGAAGHGEVIRFERLTDLAGLEEYPALSPDGRSVAFTSDSSGHRQIWVKLIGGGPPLQITHDASEHLYPRWSRDSASILYFAPPREGEEQGALWELPALGGEPRRLVSSLSDCGVSHDGQKLAFFQLTHGQVRLVVTDRDGAGAKAILQAPPTYEYVHPRWSPNDHTIAYEHAAAIWADDVYTVNVSGGKPRQVTTEGDLMNGLAWTQDGSGIVYSSARNNTVLYLPIMHLWFKRLDGGPPQQLTFGEDSYEGPDTGDNGTILASYRHMHYDIWKYPVAGTATENVRNGERVTQQTGQVQTPSLSPDGNQMAYLSDSGGHGNIWVMRLDNRQIRQLTYERDAGVTVGVPIWSPDGKSIAFARITGGARLVSYYMVNPDGSNVREVIPEGSWATWSPDSHWLYYSQDSPTAASRQLQTLKVKVDGGSPVVVRSDFARGPAVSTNGMYYVVPQQNVSGALDYEVRAAHPENGPSQPLLHIPSGRVPTWQGLHPVLSHNEKWLAIPLNDSFGTNLWLLSTADAKLRQLTDFGERRTFIARRVAWSPDDRFLYAAVGDGDADVVLLQGLVP
ncbi:MAG TPA: protein kinase [Terriglobales bacterium]|nr:protein kinase [Terriglobales bacterium]